MEIVSAVPVIFSNQSMDIGFDTEFFIINNIFIQIPK